MSEMSEDIPLAEESLKTQKTREKLRRRLQQMDESITPQALKRKSLEIHRWIARHAPHRVVLKAKTISLFDENKNTAELSQKVGSLMLQLKKISKERVET